MVENELLDEVVAGLASRKGQWKQIAADVDGVSYSWIAQVGRGKYTSDPAYSRLQAVAAWLRGHPTPEAKAGEERAAA
jgi:predicted transcriptional regulator